MIEISLSTLSTVFMINDIFPLSVSIAVGNWESDVETI